MKIIIILCLSLIFISCKPSINELVIAIENKNSVLVKELINKGVDIKSTPENIDLLKLAIKSNNLDIIKFIIIEDVKFNFDVEDYVVILKIIDDELLGLMMEKGFDPLTIVEENATFIDWVIRNNRINYLQVLIENGFDINSTVNKDGENIFHYGYWKFDNEALKYLIDNGIDINSKSKNNQTILSRFIEKRDINLVQYAIENDADIKLTGSMYNDRWEQLAEYWLDEYIELADLFISNGLKIPEDTFALHYAVMLHQYKFIEWLLKNRIRTDIQDEFGYYAIDYTHEILKNYEQNSVSDEMSREDRNNKANWIHNLVNSYSNK